jgi:HEAT repeats
VSEPSVSDAPGSPSQDTRPKAQNGVLFVGLWDEATANLVREQWPYATTDALSAGLHRIDLSRSERGLCPGINDTRGLISLSRAAKGVMVAGFFCDSITGREGVRVFESGVQLRRARVEWARPTTPDPLTWPVGSLALSLRIPVDQITTVARPARPPLIVAMQDMVNGGDAETPELRHDAIRVMGHSPQPEITELLGRLLTHEDWVTRFHAARSYASLRRPFGEGGLPSLADLLDDEDEGVRESALRGVATLIHDVDLVDRAVHALIDAAVARGLADEDEDVRAAAEEAQRLRAELLG